jgi:ornithine decarboxylase
MNHDQWSPRGGPLATVEAPIAPADAVARARAFLDETQPRLPCLVVVLDAVEQAYADLRAALPAATPYYAIKACPQLEVVERLAQLGSRFDIASRPELDMCLGLGVPADRLSFGNTIKHERDIAYAYDAGVRLFAIDSEQELEKVARSAPGSAVLCRALVENAGAQWPLSRKFGCEPRMVTRLLCRAEALGLEAGGVSFHVGSQQLDPGSWAPAIAMAATCLEQVAAVTGTRPPLLDIGGGFPGTYAEPVLPVTAYAAAIEEALEVAFGSDRPALICEPGRSLVADAGVLRSEVVLVSRKRDDDEVRWVYLDVGRFGGLAETEGEAINYRIACSRPSDDVGPVILAGPTCDSLDVIYEHRGVQLPLDLAPGDTLDFLSTGAYTAAYAAVDFNGFPPPPVYCI